MLMKEMKRDLGKCGDIPCSWIEGSTIREISVIPTLSLDLTQFLSKSQWSFCRHEQAYSDIYIEKPGCRIDRTVLQKNKMGRIHSSQYHCLL